MTAFRLAAGIILLAATAMCTWRTVDGLSARRALRMELAEISHVRYGLLNADRWVEKMLPILDADIDALDWKASNTASLKPMVENALYRLLENVKDKMSAKGPPATGMGALLQGNPLVANMMVGALRPQVPEYADMVLTELQRPQNKAQIKTYLKSVLADGAKKTFGNVDLTWYSAILKQHACPDVAACQQQLSSRIREDDSKVATYSVAALLSTALAFILLLTGKAPLRRSVAILLLLFCVVLLTGGLLTPMIEVEAKISRLSMTFLGTPIEFGEQVLYFQSKSVLEVFQTLIEQGRPDMWIVGILVLTFSVVFPVLKILTSVIYLFRTSLLRENRLAKFLVLESSKWSMADVMALAIFMSFVAFNGLIAHTMGELQGAGANLVLPTDSSKILPGYYLFLGYCIASLFLSKKLERGIRTSESA